MNLKNVNIINNRKLIQNDMLHALVITSIKWIFFIILFKTLITCLVKLKTILLWSNFKLEDLFMIMDYYGWHMHQKLNFFHTKHQKICQ
jgi:hypothetical protein